MADLPFAGFLRLLESRGFSIGIEHHLRLSLLLDRLQGQCHPKDLSNVLAPIFATSRQEQHLFHELFSDYYYDEGAASAETLKSPNSASPRGSAVIRLIQRWREILIGLAIGLALLTGGILLMPRAEPRANVPKRSNSAVAVRPALAADAGFPKVTPRAEPSSQGVLPDVPEVEADNWTQFKVWLNRVQFYILHDFPPVVLAAIFGCSVAYLFIDSAWRLFRRRLVVQRKGHAPRAWALRLPAIVMPETRTARFRQVARHLRQREALPTGKVLSVERSVAATIGSGGLTHLVFEARHRQPQYLVLIDRASFSDHQALRCAYHARALVDYDVQLDIFFFSREPRFCVDEAGRTSHLTELQRDYLDHRLLVFSDGLAFLNQLTGAPVEWLDLLGTWPRRALLVPDVRGRVPGRAVQEFFEIQPATTAGLENLAAGWSVNAADRTGRAPLLRGSPLDHEIAQLETSLGKQAFRWLCACAVYPELHYNVTMHLAGIIYGSAERVPEQDEVNLFSLPWFRIGRMPDPVRRQLTARLPLLFLRNIRQGILELLAGEWSDAGPAYGQSLRLHESSPAHSQADGPGSETGIEGGMVTMLTSRARVGALPFSLPSIFRPREAQQKSAWFLSLRQMLRSSKSSVSLQPFSFVNLAIWGVIALAALFGGLAYVWTKNQLYTTGTEIRALERELSELKNKNEVSRSKIAQLSSTAMLQQRYNAGFFKLVPITSDKIVVIPLETDEER